MQQAVGASRCLFAAFKAWLEDEPDGWETAVTVASGAPAAARRGQFPVPGSSAEVIERLQDFLASAAGAKFKEDIAFSTDSSATGRRRIRWIRAHFFSVVPSFAPGFKALPVFDAWEAAVKRLGKEGAAFSVSHTTRNPRPGEEDGVHYHFAEVDTCVEINQ